MSEGEAASLSRGTPSGHKGQSKTTDATKKRQGERNKQKHKESAKQVCALRSGDFSVDDWRSEWFYERHYWMILSNPPMC